MKKISLIGSTGSIGRQVIDVVGRYPEKYKIVSLVSGSGGEEFERQLARLKPEAFAVASKDEEGALRAAAYDGADIVFNAAGGFAGLSYSVAAVNAGKTLALANKETLVCGGEEFTRLAKSRGVQILPVDSEHSAIWQCLNFNPDTKVRRLIITASGGAFRDYPFERLKEVTAEQALAHPTWKMGKKITVDSATLMNKGYEVIEAHILYGTPYGDIHTVIQPQSIIHSMAEFSDGAVMAQMSYPTMELPIQLALSYPKRLAPAVEPMDFTRAFSLDFKPLVRESYPCFDLALRCGEKGGTLPCVLNAADEVAVNAFLKGKIAFTDIYRVADGTVQAIAREEVCLNGLKEVDLRARAKAEQLCAKIP